MEKIVEGTPGTRDVQNPLKVARTNLQLAVDPQKASLLGVPTVEFDRAVRLSVAGIPTGTFKDPSGEQYDIVVRTPVGRARRPRCAQARCACRRLTGATLPISQLATLRVRESADPDPALQPRARRHDRRGRAARLQHREGHGGGGEAAGRHELAARLSLRAGRRGAVERRGLRRHRHGDHRRRVRHLRDPRARVRQLQIDADRADGRAARRVRRPRHAARHRQQHLVHRSIGFIALVGIEIKNSILLVDFTNQLREQGVALDEAIEQAGEIRFLPILLTSATAIGGLLPLAVQNIGLYSPMAWVIIGGLISSTLLARLVTPVMYKLIPPAIQAAVPEAKPLVSVGN